MIGEEKCTKFHFQLVRSPAKTCNVVQSTGGHLIKARSRILSHPRLKGPNLPNKRNFMTTSSEVPNNCNNKVHVSHATAT